MPLLWINGWLSASFSHSARSDATGEIAGGVSAIAVVLWSCYFIRLVMQKLQL
jgi:hypothetical protein